MSPSDGSSVTFRRTPPDFRRRTVERFARRLQNEVAKGRAFDCLITGDAELRRLNRDFRSRDYPTDVLSFPAARQPLADARREASNRQPLADARGSDQSRDRKGALSSSHLGDLAISLARARAQAREFGHDVEHEISILMLHGLLHLLGMDHEVDQGQMARAEKRWRNRLGLSSGLIERVSA